MESKKVDSAEAKVEVDSVVEADSEVEEDSAGKEEGMEEGMVRPKCF